MFGSVLNKYLQKALRKNSLSVTKVILSLFKKKKKEKRKRNATVKKGDVSAVVKRSNLPCDFAGISRSFFGNEKQKIIRQVVVAVNVP